MEGTLADGPYGSAQSRGVDDRCGGFLSINNTPVGLSTRNDEHSVNLWWCMEDLKMTYVHSYLILSAVYHQVDGPSLYYALPREIIILQDTSGSS